MTEIRAHHLLCTALYTGHGYSDGFTAGMTKITQQLRGNTAGAVVLSDRPDGICAGCPKRSADGRSCAADHNDTVTMDRKVLNFLHLSTDRTYTYDELLETAEKNFTRDMFDAVCGPCSWHAKGLCRWEDLIRRCAEISAAPVSGRRLPDPEK
jgi:hypothetical protein